MKSSYRTETHNETEKNYHYNYKKEEKKDIIKEKLESINPLEITPMEALNILYELKNEMKKQEKK